jgi:uncharacterized protein (DUF58 family)
MSMEISSAAFEPSRTSRRDVLNHDFCPWANRYVYWLKKPIGWLFSAAAISALLGIYVSPQAMAISGSVLALIALGTLWPAIAMKGIRGQLTWQRQRSVEGELIETILEVTNRWPWPVWGLSIESDSEVVNNGARNSHSVSLACLRPLSTTQFRWDARPTERGLYPEKASFLTTAFPFGIWTARAALTIPRSLLVWPESIDLHDMPNLSGAHRSVVGAWIDKAGHEGDVIGVRPFRDGDSLRNVHWAQSAKSESLIVCERQSVSRRSVVLKIDASPLTEANVKEWVVRVGGSIARTFLTHNWSVRIEIDGAVLQSEPGEKGLRDLMDLLATFDRETPSLVQKELPKKDLRNKKLTSKDTLQLVVTTSDRVLQVSNSSENINWVLVDAQRQDYSTALSEFKPWMHVDVSQPVWPQVQSQWDRVCHANASMVAT